VKESKKPKWEGWYILEAKRGEVSESQWQQWDGGKREEGYR